MLAGAIRILKSFKMEHLDLSFATSKRDEVSFNAGESSEQESKEEEQFVAGVSIISVN